MANGIYWPNISAPEDRPLPRADDKLAVTVLSRRDGNLLAMRSGAVYQILDNAARITFWLPLTRVSICEQFVNVNGVVAVFYEIRNQDGAEMVSAARAR